MDPEVVAHHEAGHAVIAHLVEVPFVFVTIEGDETAHGHCQGAPFPDWFDPGVEVDREAQDLIERHIMWGWAGPLAEEMFTGQFNDVGAAPDLETVYALANFATGGDTEQTDPFVAWLRAKTAAQLRGPIASAWVERVAARLLEVKRLTSAQVGELAFDPAGVAAILSRWASAREGR